MMGSNVGINNSNIFIAIFIPNTNIFIVHYWFHDDNHYDHWYFRHKCQSIGSLIQLHEFKMLMIKHHMIKAKKK